MSEKVRVDRAITTTATERDLKLMRWIGTNGVASYKQLFTVFFWPEAKERTCQERLLQLGKAGWIERYYVDTTRKRGEQVYCLTKQGARKFFESGERRWLMVGLPSRSELKQQLTAQDTRIVLERQLAGQGKRLIRWVNERELRTEAAFLRRPAGSKGWVNLADIPDGRIFVGKGIASAYSESEKYRVDVTGNENKHCYQQDAGAVLQEDEDVQQIEIEIDGQYYGKMLKSKIATLFKSKRPSLWVTGSNRAIRIESEIKLVGATNIQVLVVDPLV